MSQTLSEQIAGVACAALVAGVLVAAATFAQGCGDDGDGDSGPTGEECFQVGAIDANCLCAGNRPRGIRTCQEGLVWSECVCGEPFEEPCVEGEPVQCPPCEGETRGHTTTCLRAGTFDCGCDGSNSSALTRDAGH